MGIIDFFKKIGSAIAKALGFAHERGLDDALINLALKYVAGQNNPDNSIRRETVVDLLINHAGVPESVARLAVELAVQLFKGSTDSSSGGN